MAFVRKSSPLSVPTILIGGSNRGGSVFESTIIANSALMSIGDVIIPASQASGNGAVVKRYNAAGDKILGVCVGFKQASGKKVAFDSGSSTTVTVASDNETVAQIYAIVDVTPNAVWSAPFASAAVIHATAIFRAGAQVEVATGTAAGSITETTVSLTASAHLSCVALGPDPEDSTRGLVMINEGLYKGSQTAS